MDYNRKINEIMSLLDQGYVQSAMQAAGTTLENLLRELLGEAIALTSGESRDRLIGVERRIGNGKSMASFGLGQLVGMAREGKLFSILEKDLGRPIRLFRVESLNPIIDLRNVATHDDADLCEQDVAYVVDQLRLLLRETHMGDADGLPPGKKPRRIPLVPRLVAVVVVLLGLGLAVVVLWPSTFHRPATTPDTEASNVHSPPSSLQKETSDQAAAARLTQRDNDSLPNGSELPSSVESSQLHLRPASLPNYLNEDSETAGSEATRIAVLYFENNSPGNELDVLRKGLADMMIGDLSRAPGLRVVEREDLEKVLTELELQRAPEFDEATTVKIGRLLGVEYLVMGSFFELMGQFRVDSKIVHVETGAIRKAAGVEGTRGEFMRMERDLVEELFTGFRNTPHDRDDNALRSGPHLTWDESIRYSYALDKYDAGEHAGALELLKELLAAHPDFIPARRIERLIEDI